MPAERLIALGVLLLAGTTLLARRHGRPTP